MGPLPYSLILLVLSNVTQSGARLIMMNDFGALGGSKLFNILYVHAIKLG